MSNHYGFFTSIANSQMHNQMSFVASSTSPGHVSRGEIQGNGLYLYKENLRFCIVLFTIRSVVKTNWINKDNVYIHRKVWTC
jgi:hypothetical protein